LRGESRRQPKSRRDNREERERQRQTMSSAREHRCGGSAPLSARSEAARRSFVL
jgi:hypothetical protein